MGLHGGRRLRRGEDGGGAGQGRVRELRVRSLLYLRAAHYSASERPERGQRLRERLGLALLAEFFTELVGQGFYLK
jgi:hypothetical protein